MSKYKENECDKLVQQIAVLGGSQWSGLPAECGHHIIHRGSYLWRWRLMNIAPLSENEDELRALFSQMKELKEKYGLKELSMGMSQDYKIALECGATMIRLGRILFN